MFTFAFRYSGNFVGEISGNPDAGWNKRFPIFTVHTILVTLMYLLSEAVLQTRHRSTSAAKFIARCQNYKTQENFAGPQKFDVARFGRKIHIVCSLHIQQSSRKKTC